MIIIRCKNCNNTIRLLDINLRKNNEIKCKECGRVLIPEYKKW